MIPQKYGQILKAPPDSRLMHQSREVFRYHHYAYRTEPIYCQWILPYVLSSSIRFKKKGDTI